MIIPQIPWRKENGASRRLYLDPPSLKGFTFATIVHIRKRIDTRRVGRNDVNNRERLCTYVNDVAEGQMMSFTEIALPRKKRAAKSRIVGVPVTEAEFLRLSHDADFAGRTLSNWAHDRLVGSEVIPAHSIEQHSFTELVGIQMLVMACFSPLLQGQPITAEEYEELVRRAQSGKAKRAKELLAQRMGHEEK